VRLLLQERDTAHFVSASKAGRETRGAGGAGAAGGAPKKGAKRLMRELDELQDRNVRLREAVVRLEDELREAKKAGLQVRALKERMVTLLGKQMREKGMHFLANKAIHNLEKQVAVLSDHVERLMLHLKHEVTDKARYQQVEGRAFREMELLRARNDTIAGRNFKKDKVILELQEGERILEVRRGDRA
jgi:hypothetical protein